MHIGQLFTQGHKVHSIQKIDDITGIITFKNIVTGDINTTDKELIENLLKMYSFNDLLINICDVWSVEYPYVIFDLQGNLAGSKIPKIEYNINRRKVEDPIKYHSDNIKVIAKEYFDMTEIDIIQLPKIYADCLFKLHFHIRTKDFLLQDLSMLFEMMKDNDKYNEYTLKS